MQGGSHPTPRGLGREVPNRRLGVEPGFVGDLAQQALVVDAAPEPEQSDPVPVERAGSESSAQSLERDSEERMRDRYGRAADEAKDVAQ